MFSVTPEEVGERLDKLLVKRYPDRSRTYFQNLIKQGLVLLNGSPPQKREKPQVGDQIEVSFAPPQECSLDPEDIPLDILYEDEWILAVNKPAGMVVHPAKGNWSGTFVNALLHHCQSLPENGLRPGIVHRLDKETSGVMLAAKTPEAQTKLIEAFAERTIEKEYLAICVGNPGTCVINAPIGRHPKDRKKYAIIQNGKPSETKFELIATDGHLSLVKCFPKTGRTHQIRVHMQSKRTPVLGDSLYGNNKFDRHLLHAHRIAFTHPITNEPLEITAPPPADLAKIAETLLQSAQK